MDSQRVTAIVMIIHRDDRDAGRFQALFTVTVTVTGSHREHMTMGQRPSCRSGLPPQLLQPRSPYGFRVLLGVTMMLNMPSICVKSGATCPRDSPCPCSG